MRIVRVGGLTGLLVAAVILVFLIAAAILALRILIWLLPVIIVVMAAWVLLYIFNKPRKEKPLDIDFRVKD